MEVKVNKREEVERRLTHFSIGFVGSAFNRSLLTCKN